MFDFRLFIERLTEPTAMLNFFFGLGWNGLEWVGRCWGTWFGHDMSRPRAVLAMPTAAELALAEEQEGAGADEDGDPDEGERTGGEGWEMFVGARGRGSWYDVALIKTIFFSYVTSTEFGSLKVPFSSRLWSIRLAVQRGYEALYTVQVGSAPPYKRTGILILS